MTTLLLSLLLAVQGIPIPAQQAGTVSGVLKDQAGKPLAGVRMAAVAKPEVPGDTLAGAAMASIAETDSDGRYTLENVPPGRYYIAAGRVDVQTYFPGTPQMTSAREVAVAAGSKVAGIDFALDQKSFGRSDIGGLSTRPATIEIPLAVTVEGGGAWPISGNGKFTTIVVTSVNGGCCSPMMLSVASLAVTYAQVGAYRVTIDNLPETFVVKSMTYGSTNLLTDSLKITPANFPPTRTVILYSAGIPALPNALQPYPSVAVASPATQTNLPSFSITTNVSQNVPPSPILVTLARVTSQNISGVRVSGTLNVRGARTVYLSGIPGNIYSNGSFDVFGVPAGRHVIATRDNPNSAKPLGATVVVESEDLADIDLDEIEALPK